MSAHAPASPETAAARAAALAEIGRAFKQTTAAIRRLRGREAHRPGELSHAQYTVLFELLSREELHTGELAAVAGVAPASMTEMLDRLAEGGLVERSRSERDRRVVVCRLTEAGRRRCEERHAQIAPLWEAALAGYGAEELTTAAAVLDSLRAMFDRLDELESA